MIPYGRQCIEQDDIDAVTTVLRGDFLTTGPAVEAFEKAFCGVTGARHAVVCSNGTAALHLAAMALGLGPGDAAIVPSITFLATANALRFTGAEVIFADVDPETGLMDAGHLDEAMARANGARVRAVFPVHLAGQCVDLKKLRGAADAHGLKIITDACHAVGATYAGTPAGTCMFEDMAAFSFHPVKTIAMGEGGAVTTNNGEWAEAMRRHRNHGMVKKPEFEPWVYQMPEPGYNYRASDIHCALGLSQLKKLDRFVRRRRELVTLYDRLLQPLSNIVQLPARVTGCESAWHLYAVRIDFAAAGLSRAELMSRLKDKGIGTQVHYIPVHSQPYYRNRYKGLDLPGAQRYYERTLSLPLYPGLTDEDAHRVVDTLKAILEA